MSDARSRWLPAVVTMALVALAAAGCGGDDSPTPTSASSDAATASSSLTPTVPLSSLGATPSSGPADVTDPCRLLGPRDYSLLVQDRLADVLQEHPGLSTQDTSIVQCEVDVDLLPAIEFGWSTRPGAYDDAYRQTKPDKILGTKRLGVPGVGDRAFEATTAAGIVAYAQVGDTTFSLFASSFTGDTDGAEISATLTALVGAGTGRVDPDPIVLPAACPPADSPLVTNLIGTVVYGRGGGPRGLADCTYAAADGTYLSTSATVMTKGGFDNEYQQESAGGKGFTVLDGAPGVVRESFNDRRANTFALFEMYPGPRLHEAVVTGIADDTGLRDAVGTQDAFDAFDAFADSYLSQVRPH